MAEALFGLKLCISFLIYGILFRHSKSNYGIHKLNFKGMSISPPEVSSIPCVFGANSSTPVMIDCSVFVSHDTCDPTPMDGETQQRRIEDTNRQQGDEADDDSKFRVPKMYKTSEAWDDDRVQIVVHLYL